MALTVQNLRAVGPGVEPPSLLPGQICFNVADKIIFVGDGSGLKTSFDGTQVPGTPGEGWYSMPMDFESLGDYFVPNPGYWGDTPTDQQVLSWSAALNHPIWSSGGGGGSGQVYIVTNNEVALAPGATVSAKITAAIGVASPDEGDVTIVTGLPDDVYEGLYFFTTEWVRGASYAYPSATEVIYDNTVSGLTAATVQGAIDEVVVDLAATTAIANTANSTATSALSIANAALPKAGGTMVGTIVSRNISVQSGYNLEFLGAGYIQFNGGASGVITGISDSVLSTSSIVAASSNAVLSAWQLADAALPKAGGIMTGTISFAAGQVFPVSGIQDASATQKGIVQIGTNIDVASGVISVKTADASQLGLVQVGTNIDVASGVISVKTATNSDLGLVQTGAHIQNTSGVISVLESSTTTKGVVQLNDTVTSSSILQALTANQGRVLQNQINNLSIAGGVTLAGGFDPNIPAMESVTTSGAGAGFNIGSDLPLPAAASNYYVIIVADDNSYSPPGGGGPYMLVNGDWLLSDGVAWNYLGVGQRPASASYNTAGIVQLADCTATLAGTSDILAITPQSLCDITTSAVNNTCDRCLASALAVKTVNDTALAALPKAGGTMTGNITFQDPGEGILFNGGSQLFAISNSTSTTSSTTAASSTALKTAYDLAAAAIPCSRLANQGDILATNSSGVPTALPRGTNGQVLIVNTACATGLEWVTDTPGDVTSVTGSAPIQVDNTDPQNPVVSIDAASTASCGAVQLNDNTNSSSTTEAATANSVCQAYALADAANTTANAAIPCAAFTALGDLLGGTGVGTYSALGVGTSGQVLLVDPLSPNGLAWGDACYVPDACFTAAGDIVVGTGAGTYVSLPVGTDCQTLVVNSACTATGGVTWGVSLTGYTCSVAVGNTALGIGAGDSITTGLHNTVIGSCAGTAISAGDNNTLVGWCTGDGLTSGNNNTVVGALAFSNTGGSNNTIMGYCSGAALTTGNSNTLIGSSAGDTIAGGNSIVGVGQGVLGGAVTAAGTVAIGATAGAALTSGANTTLVGFAAGDSITSGARNTVVGHTAGGALTAGADNTIVGALAGNLATGTGSTILGSCAGAALTLGGANVFLGAGAGDLVTTGFNNTIIGDVGGSTTLTGNAILAAGTTVKFQANNSGAWSYDGTNFGTAGQFLASQGSAATPIWCTLSLACVPCAAYTAKGDILAGTGAATFSALPVGTNGQVLVPNSSCATGLEWITVGALCLQGYTCTATPFNTALGGLAGDSITSGTNNTTVGYNSGTGITTGTSNVLVGSCAGTGVNVQGDHVAVGHQTLIGTLDINNSGLTAVGTCALRAVTTGLNNIGIGFRAGLSITTGGCNIAIGACALDSVATTANNIGIGFSALTNITSGAENLGIGTCAGAANTTGSNNVSIGYLAGCATAANGNNTYLGAYAGRAQNSTNNTAVGTCALANSGVNNNTAVGFSAGAALTTGGSNTFVGAAAGDSATTADNAVAVGYNALGGVHTAAGSVAVGANALAASTSGVGNVAVGFNAGAALTTGACNVFIGHCAGDVATGITCTVGIGVNALGASAATTGTVAIGASALAALTTGDRNVAVGFLAGLSVTSGIGNTLIGYRAGDAISTTSNNTIIGNDAGNLLTGGGNNVFIGSGAGDTVSTGSSNTIIGNVSGSAALANNLILAAGTTIKLQVNENGAVGVGSTPSYGTAGQVLQSAGTAAAPAWTTPVWQPLTTLTTTATTATTLLSVPVASTRAVFIDISVSDVTSGNYHTDSYQVVTDGTVTDDQQIAGARIGVNPYTLTSAIVGANLVISVTSASTNSTKYVGSYQTFAV